MIKFLEFVNNQIEWPTRGQFQEVLKQRPERFDFLRHERIEGLGDYGYKFRAQCSLVLSAKEKINCGYAFKRFHNQDGFPAALSSGHNGKTGMLIEGQCVYLFQSYLFIFYV